jgi:hypothetical protein
MIRQAVYGDCVLVRVCVRGGSPPAATGIRTLVWLLWLVFVACCSPVTNASTECCCC